MKPSAEERAANLFVAWHGLPAMTPHEEELQARLSRALEIAYRDGLSDGAAREREACAKVCDAIADELDGEECSGGDCDRRHTGDARVGAERSAEAIRRRAEGGRGHE